MDRSSCPHTSVGASSVAATFIGQRLQGAINPIESRNSEAENLYGLFVKEAVGLQVFVDAIQKSKIRPAKIMRLYSKVARIPSNIDRSSP